MGGKYQKGRQNVKTANSGKYKSKPHCELYFKMSKSISFRFNRKMKGYPH